MKKRLNQFASFKNSVNSIDYRDNAVVISQYNMSVRLYKRFLELNKAGDYELASEKIGEAGTALYRCCEWGFKNYLFRRYSELKQTGDITSTVYVNKVDLLSNKSTTLFDLINDFKAYSSPTYTVVGVNVDEILHNAKAVNNEHKHIARIPDPAKFKITLGEARKLLKNYIDSSVKLDLVEDSIYGEGNAWYEVLENTNDFSEAYSYVLVTKRIENADINGLFSLKWDLIIDWDSATDVDGLENIYEKQFNVLPWKRMLNQVESHKKFAYSGLPHWVFANGLSDNPESVASIDKWSGKYGKFLSPLLEEFHKVYTRPVKVFIYPTDFDRNIERIVQVFDDNYNDGDDVEYFVVSSDSEFARIDGENFNKIDLSFGQLCENLAKMNEEKIFVSKISHRSIPTAQASKVEINEGFYAELLDSFEVVYEGIDETEEQNAVKTSRRDFFCGNTDISWYGLRENFDVRRQEIEKVKEKLTLDLKEKRGRLFTKVVYEPGVGGTTMLRRIAWEFCAKYPTLILKNNNEQTSRNVQKIYDMTNMPILILADSNNVEIEDVKKLHFEFKTMGFAFVICYFERKTRGYRSEDGAVYTVLSSLNGHEARDMANRLNDYIKDDSAKSAIANIVQDDNSKERSPFIMSMYAFDDEFKGIKPYISKYLKGMNVQTKKILFDLALADYGNVSLDIQYFVNLYGNDSASLLADEMLGISDLIRMESDNGKDLVRIKYHQFGEEILRQLSLGEEATEISFLAVLDSILMFIEDSRRGAINQDVLNVLRSLFITRIADTNSEKPTFSPLIDRLKEETGGISDNSYNGSNDAIIRIFNKLVEVYPEEPHFLAHLARYYFYIDRNYELGFKNINAAIELAESILGYVDPLLYHMKGMGYSSRITNTLIKTVIQNVHDEKGEDCSEIIKKIEEDAELAFEYFEIVRKGNSGVAGHVSEINLCIQIANMAKMLMDEVDDNFCKYLSSESGNWVMKYVDRATNLWDECKKIALESNYADLDNIETRLASLTASLEDSISLWEDYLQRAEGRNKLQARRILARAYSKRSQKHNVSESQEDLRHIVELMEENMIEETQHSGNIRLWFEAIMKLQYDNQETLIMDAIIKLDRWVAISDSVEAHYYRFVLKFIQAVNGSELAKSDLPKLLRELKSKSNTLFNRTATQHWLTMDDGGKWTLMTNSRSKKDSVAEEKMASCMKMMNGRISNNYVNESHAYIVCQGVEVYFNPSATKGEINKSKINQRVKFGIGFSYDGPRAFNSSIKVVTGEEAQVVDRKIESGMVVKCEVIKNVAYFTRVRIIGFSQEGSIHIDQLISPFSAEKRPETGTVFDCLVLYEKFDVRNQKNFWMLTMNLDGENDNDGDNELTRAMKKSGFIK